MDTKHIKRVLLLTTMAIFIASGVYAEQIPLFELSYGDGSVQFFSDGDYSFTGDGSVSVGELESFADGSVRIGEFYFSQHGVGEVLLEDLFLKCDPAISVSFGITDLGDPSLFALSVITSIDPVGAPNVVAGSLILQRIFW